METKLNCLKLRDSDSKCVRATKKELIVDHDGELIDNEGDPMEEFETKAGEKKSNHSNCTLAWRENWEDVEDDNDFSKNLQPQIQDAKFQDLKLT